MRHRRDEVFDGQVRHLQDGAQRAAPHFAVIGDDDGQAALSHFDVTASLANLFKAETLQPADHVTASEHGEFRHAP